MTHPDFDSDVARRWGGWRAASFRRYLRCNQRIPPAVGPGMLRPTGDTSRYIIRIWENGPTAVRYRYTPSLAAYSDELVPDATRAEVSSDVDTSLSSGANPSNGRAVGIEEKGRLVNIDAKE